MASGIIRSLQQWLVVFLFWFILRGSPVTQELTSTHEDVSVQTEVDSSYPQQEATPHLLSFGHTETIIADNIGHSSLIISPAIAPATPWDDFKTSSSVSDSIYNHDESKRQAPNKKQGLEKISQTQKLEEETEFNIDDGLSTGGTEKEKIAHVNDNNNDLDDFDQRAPAKNQDTSSELPPIHGSSIDGHETERNSANKQDRTSQLKDSKDNKLEGTKADLSSEEEKVEPEDTVAGDIPVVDGEKLNGYVDDSQAPDGDEDLVGTRDDLKGAREDMPSFKEWSLKFLELEEQKNKVQQNNEKGSSEADTVRKKKKSERKQNNYASLDCGAKILEKNAEAQHAESILIENKDLYMLNPCSANIWFIVELCDHVQVTSLQLANFELFSSTVDKFQVSFSTRYPTRDWTQLQTFTAKSEKTLQTFTIDPIFAKYMKVEQLSYHGSEHYCPWSLLRVYGNSMVEEYEEHVSSQNAESPVEDEESSSSGVSEDKKVSRGILKSATDAVLNFVKETAKKLVNGEVAVNSSTVGVNQTNSTNDLEESSPSHRLQDPETPKTIVQLMNREDFEANCHEVTGESSVGENNRYWPRSVCGSTECTVYSYKTFLEIVRNVCRRDSRRLKGCFTNLTKTTAANRSVEVSSLKAKAGKRVSEETSPSEKDDTVKKAPQQEKSGLTRRENSEKLEQTGIPSISRSDESSDEMAKKEDSSQDFITHSQTSFESLERHMGKSEKYTEDVAPVPPSHSSSSESISISSSISMLKETEYPSTPTPLPQPPLAVKQLPDLAELPTEPAMPNSQRRQVNKENSSDVSSGSTRPSEATVLKITSSQLSAIVDIIPSGVSAETIYPEKMAMVLREKLNTISSTNVASESLNEKSSGREDEDLVLESIKGTSEHKPDPHVDVLKITLTDEETKEGTAEPEQTTQDEHGGSASCERETKESFSKDSAIDHPTGNSEGTGTTGLKEERKTIDVVDESETKENVEPISRIEEKNVSVARSESSGERPTGESAKEHKEYRKGEEKQKTNDTLKNPELVDEKPENVDQNIVQKGTITNSENKCEQKKHEAETSNEQTTQPSEKKLHADQISSGNISQTDPEPGPSVPAGNGQTNGKKESIFVAMSRKIKALEQNVTMTNLFLEELSQRYRKSLEEMQKILEKKLSKMSKNAKLLTTVNLYQNSTILALTTRLQKVERELNETKSRMKIINQEVVERHVLGMCLQFIIVFLLWFLSRTRTASVTNAQILRETDIEHESSRNSAPGGCHETGKWKIGNGLAKNIGGCAAEEIELDGAMSSLEELSFSKPPTVETTAEGKRRRRRKNRPSSGTCDQFLKPKTNPGQNIVTKTAGLLFHSPGSHEDEKTVKHITKDSAQRSCSADGLNDLARKSDDEKLNVERPAVSPKTKKVPFRYGGKRDTDSTKAYSKLFYSDSKKFALTKEQDRLPRKGLGRSKSLGQCNENEVTLRNNHLTCSGGDSSSLSRCSLQSSRDCHQLKNQKSGWIWGLG